MVQIWRSKYEFFSMLWSKGEIIIVGFIVYGSIMRLLRILNSLRIIFWTFIKIFMPNLFLMFQIQVIWSFIHFYIPELVSSKENMMLIKCPDFLEIKTVVFNLNGNSAPNPDGFGGVFCHSCWDVIGTDVCNVVQ